MFACNFLSPAAFSTTGALTAMVGQTPIAREASPELTPIKSPHPGTCDDIVVGLDYFAICDEFPMSAAVYDMGVRNIIFFYDYFNTVNSQPTDEPRGPESQPTDEPQKPKWQLTDAQLRSIRAYLSRQR